MINYGVLDAETTSVHVWKVKKRPNICEKNEYLYAGINFPNSNYGFLGNIGRYVVLKILLIICSEGYFA